MSNQILNQTHVFSGIEIYELLVDGFKKKYNRRFNELKQYEIFMTETYQYFLSLVTRSSRRKILRKHKSWKDTNFPVEVMMIHKHKNGIECEPHLRILFGGQIFDIPFFSKNV